MNLTLSYVPSGIVAVLSTLTLELRLRYRTNGPVLKLVESWLLFDTFNLISFISTLTVSSTSIIALSTVVSEVLITLISRLSVVVTELSLQLLTDIITTTARGIINSFSFSFKLIDFILLSFFSLFKFSRHIF